MRWWLQRVGPFFAGLCPCQQCFLAAYAIHDGDASWGTLRPWWSIPAHQGCISVEDDVQLMTWTSVQASCQADGLRITPDKGVRDPTADLRCFTVGIAAFRWQG